MSVRRRLRDALNSRGGCNVCWSCTLQNPQYASRLQQPKVDFEGYIRNDGSSRPKQRSFHNGRERRHRVLKERPLLLAFEPPSSRSWNQDVKDSSKPNSPDNSSIATHWLSYQDRRGTQSASSSQLLYEQSHPSRRQLSSSSASCLLYNRKREEIEGHYVLRSTEKATDPSRVNYAPTQGLLFQYSLVSNSQFTSRSCLHKKRRKLDFVDQRRHHAIATVGLSYSASDILLMAFCSHKSLMLRYPTIRQYLQLTKS